MSFFLNYFPGGTHAPHHPTKEWVDKIHEMHLFDGGWNNAHVIYNPTTVTIA